MSKDLPAESAVSGQEPSDLTTLHVRRARQGDPQSLAWLVERLSPLLLAGARHRLGGALRRLYDPEDLVNEVWAVLIPRLGELPERDGRYTPVLLRYLTTTLLNKVGNLLQKHIDGKPGRAEIGRGGEEGTGLLASLPDTVTTALSRVVRKEREEAVTASIERLEPRERELIVLRGIEQHSYREIAAVTGVEEKLLPMRYQRALDRLRRELPESVFQELNAD